MDTYYNEWDKPTAAWLRELGTGCHLPVGHVDTRSIQEVKPGDLIGYKQCHFFAGIGGWPLALRLAGYEHLPCWTGSPPCQPFSVAGQQRGTNDERHLAPVWLNLVRECRPPILFGEQVADAIRHGWLDDLFDALEDGSYACAAAVLPACSVGAPHIRKRLFFGAVRVGNTPDISGRQCDIGSMEGTERTQSEKTWSRYGNASGTSGSIDGLADSQHYGYSRSEGITSISGSNKQNIRVFNRDSSTYGMADTEASRLSHGGDREVQSFLGEGSGEYVGSTNSHYNVWSGADWLGCRDGKFRPVEPGTQPLANGLPTRVGRLRGYGNAIVPQVAATFIKEFLGAAAGI